MDWPSIVLRITLEELSFALQNPIAIPFGFAAAALLVYLYKLLLGSLETRR
jgi:hypothetical protein